MRTIEINAYSYNELNEKAKQNAIYNYLKNADNSYIYEDFINTINKFNELFNLTSGNTYFHYTINLNTEVINLTGLRLRKYIINNFGFALFKPKYIKNLKENTKPINHKRIRVKEYKNGNFSNTYYSAINTAIDCNLTGVYTDYEILKPIHDFIEYKDTKNYFYTDFEELISDCFQNLEKALKIEEEYINSEEYILENFEINGFEFDEQGNIL